MSSTPRPNIALSLIRAIVDVTAFIAGCALGWIVFNSIALGIAFGVAFAAGTVTAQRVVKSRTS